jgi:hypothetical protein
MNFLVEVLEKHVSLLPNILAFVYLSTIPGFTEAGDLDLSILARSNLPCIASAAML